MEEIGADLSKVVDRVTKQYDKPVIAFQKEAIQNSWDVRKSRKNGENWRVEIEEFVDDNGNSHVIVQDYGTLGMNSNRWEGFSSLWKPRKDISDAGGKGQGKFVLMNASQDHLLFVESISDEGYICYGLQDNYKTPNKVEIGEQIPGAQPLSEFGTRIWVHLVKQEFFRKFRSGEFIDSLVQTWWQLLGKRFDARVFVFGEEIKFDGLPSPSQEVVLLENVTIGAFGRIKRLKLGFYDEKLPSGFDGVMLQRANMMIRKLPFSVNHKAYKGKFSGFIEFDKDLEEALKEIEKNDHCNFQWEEPWREIKKLITRESEKFVASIVPTKEEKRRLNNRNVSDAIKKANQIINEFCPEVLGGGPNMPSIPPKDKNPIRISNFSLNKREIKWKSTIKRYCGIVNDTEENEKISLEIRLSRGRSLVFKEEYKLRLKPGEQKRMMLPLVKVLEENYPKGKYTFRAILRRQRNDLDAKSTSFFLEIPREPVKRGFIKKIKPYASDEPVRNKPAYKGVLDINLGHPEFINVYETNKLRPIIRNRQVKMYLMKRCLDEAARALFSGRLKADQYQDVDEVIREVIKIQDVMYAEIHA